MNPIDLSRLRDFSDGTPEGLAELSAMFRDHMLEAANLLRPASAAGDAEVLRVEAHKAAGTAGACGAWRLSELFRAMEMLATEGTVSRAPGVMAEIDAEIARVAAALEQSR
jgi:HPt (histidine-containing phosphotransfer) domain-containing protein